METRTLKDILKETRDTDPRVRSRAARNLCPCELRMDDPKAWERVFELARDPDAHVRRTVFHTLVDGSPRRREAEVVSALEGMWNDPDLKLRRQVRRLLARYRATGKINEH